MDVFGGQLRCVSYKGNPTKKEVQRSWFDEKYGDVIVYRWEKLTKKKAILLERAVKESVHA